MNENPRLFENFLLLGLDHDISRLSGTNLAELSREDISILSMVPGKIALSDYLENLKYWSFPQGLKVFDEFLNEVKGKETPLKRKIKRIEEMEIIEQFVITDAKSVKRYCSSLIFYEKQFIRKDKASHVSKPANSSFLPKVSMSTLINNPLSFKDTGYSMVYIPKALCVISKMPIFHLELQILEMLYQRVLLPLREPFIHKSRIFSINQQEKVKEKKLLDFYVTSLFSLFTLSEKDCKVAFMDLDCDQPKQLMSLQINNTIGLSVPSFDFFMLFERLSVDNLLLFFEGVLLEKQIIIFGESSRELTNICETMLSLINPLTWGCIYVPYLPMELWETLHAMMPYVIGLDIRHREDLFSKLRLNDKLIIDLSLNTVENTDNLHLPQSVHQFLSSKITHILRAGRSLETVLRIKQIFLCSMYLIINNIEDFFYFRECDAAINSQNSVSSEVFNFYSFLDFFRGEQQSYEFMETLCHNTMMFNKFIEDCFLVKGVDTIIVEDDSSHFLQEIRKIKKHHPNCYIFDIIRQPNLLDEIIKEQNLEIMELVSRFEMAPYEEKTILPLYLKFAANKAKNKVKTKTKEQFPDFFAKLNHSLQAIPKVIGDLQLLRSPIQIHKESQDLTTKSSRKRQPIQRLASYEKAGENKEGCSPSSQLISKIKSFYFYYHAVKRNQTYDNYRRFTHHKKEKKEETPSGRLCEKSTPFFRELAVVPNSTQEIPQRNETNIELVLVEHKTPNNNTKSKTNMVNPQDSSCEVTPDNVFRKEPENFSQWMMDNSMRNMGRWERIKENLKEKEIVDKRLAIRSLSPKKKKKEQH